MLLQGFPAKCSQRRYSLNIIHIAYMEKSWGDWVTCIVIKIVWWPFGKLPMASLIWKSNIPQEHLFRIISNWIKNSLYAFCRIFLWSMIFEKKFLSFSFFIIIIFWRWRCLICKVFWYELLQQTWSDKDLNYKSKSPLSLHAKPNLMWRRWG